MEKYFYVNHARRTCVTAYPNLVTKTQKFPKSSDLLDNYSQNEVLLSWEYLDVFVDVLKTIRRENGGKTYQKQCDFLCYLPTRLVPLSRCP